MPNELGIRKIELNGYYGETYPVSEARLEIISNTLKEVEKEKAKHENKAEIPRSTIGKIRRVQMEVMVKFDAEVPDSVYESKEFNLSLLHDLQSFFLMNAMPV